MSDGKVLHCSDDLVVPIPEQGTAIEFILAQTEKAVLNGHGDSKWITETDSGEAVTLKEIEPVSRSIASWFFKRSMRRHDVLLFCSRHSPSIYLMFLGVWRANGTLRSAHPDETIETMAERMRESHVKWFLCDPDLYPKAEQAVKSVPWPVEIITFGQVPGCASAQDLIDDDGKACPQLRLDGDSPAIILSTSGTSSSVAKGVVHTQKGLALTLAYSVYYTERIHALPRLIMGLPTHVSGFILPLAFLASSGNYKEVYLMRGLTVESMFKAIHQYKPQTILGLPAMFLGIARAIAEQSPYDFSSIRILVAAGTPVTPAFTVLMKRALPGVQILPAFGMTECIFPIVPPAVIGDPRAFGVGVLPLNTLLQVRDLETGLPTGANKAGELFLKSPIMAQGYLVNGEVERLVDDDGWFHMGDVGYFGEDGYVYVVDRAKEVFKCNRTYVIPSEIENAIQTHPSVAMVGVVGARDPVTGEDIPIAYVTLKDDKTTGCDILKHANEKLPPCKQITGGVRVIETMPLGKTGKVDRKVLKELKWQVERRQG